MSKDAYYFSHDSNMWNDPKIIKVRRKHGIIGYGVVNRLNEMLRNESRLGLDADTLDDIIFDINDPMVTREMLDDIILHYKLYERDDAEDGDEFGFFYSNRMRRNMEKIEDIKQKRSYAGQMSGKARQVLSTSLTGVQQKRTMKGKEKKQKEIKLNISFEEFWNLYNYKVGDKKKVEVKWKSLSDDDRISVMAHIPLYIQSTPDKQYRKHPTTYLNNTGWEDEILNNSNGSDKFKLSTAGFPQAYCDKCGILAEYRTEELNGDSRCCQGKLLENKPVLTQ